VPCIKSDQGADREGDRRRVAGMQIAKEVRVDERWPWRWTGVAGLE